jgi:hypothetical protein
MNSFIPCRFLKICKGFLFFKKVLYPLYKLYLPFMLHKSSEEVSIFICFKQKKALPLHQIVSK